MATPSEKGWVIYHDGVKMLFGDPGSDTTTPRFIWRASGSPEGNETGPVGSVCLRFDGGAGTTWYVKESGTGNTGWVGK